MNLRTALILGLSSLALLGGCATTRSELAISPPAIQGKTKATGKTVFIVEATDHRTFEATPRSPSTPSLNPNAVQNDSIRARAFGRERNAYGKALNDVVLPQGQTVGKLMTNTIGQAFVEKGYRLIKRREDATPDTLIVEADVQKFWMWMTPAFSPGFASYALSAEISTDLTFRTGEQSRTLTLPVTASDHFHFLKKGNWIKIADLALRAYVDDLKAKLE